MSVQAGDILAVAQLIKTIYEYGWDDKMSASREFQEFQSDVVTFITSLQSLENVIDHSRRAFRQRIGYSDDMSVFHQDRLEDVIGCYKQTLQDCCNLLQQNRRYEVVSGPRRNLAFNILVRPEVDRLRGRLKMHNLRIQNALRPMEIDLLVRVHEKLDRLGAQMQDVAHELRKIHHRLQELRCIAIHGDNGASSQAEFLVQSPEYLEIPGEIRNKLEKLFSDHPDVHDGDVDALHGMVDAVLLGLETITAIGCCWVPGQREKRQIPLSEYGCLLKCIFLMEKIKQCGAITNPEHMSHWPSCVQNLEERLYTECRRVTQGRFSLPDPANIADEMLTLWSVKSEPVYVQSFDEPADELLDLTQPCGADGAERRMKLLRYRGSPKDHRLVWYAVENPTTPLVVNAAPRPSTGLECIEFDIMTAILNPVYAMAGDEESPPLEMILRSSNKTRVLKFCNHRDIFAFQQALTGYMVVDDYSQRAVVAFVLEGRDTVTEYATVQLWLFQSLEGKQTGSDSDTMVSATSFTGGGETSSVADSFKSRLTFGPRSQRSPFKRPWPILRSQEAPGGDQYSQLGSGISSLSLRRPRENLSSLTAAQTVTDSKAAPSFSSDSPVRPVVVVHARPPRPLLVFFTQSAESQDRAIVALSIDVLTKPNPDRCKCRKGFNDCVITALEAGGGTQYLDVRRFGPSAGGSWDILALARARQAEPNGYHGTEWAGASVKRVSLWFSTPELRNKFGGTVCSCETPRWKDETACMQKGHVGLFGVVRTKYRREAEVWAEMVRGPRAVITTGGGGHRT